jgi:hypothetical protein
MADIGDRVAVASKGGSRSGVVTGVSGAMVTVRWDTGGETSLIPGPGVLSVVNPGSTAATKKRSAASSQSDSAKRPMGKKAAPAKKPATKESSSGRTAGKKGR